MSISITKKNYTQLIRGASIFTTGGGVPFEDQITSVKSIKDLNAQILSLSEFPRGSYICTAAELGPTDVPPLNKDKIIDKMMNLLIQATGKEIAGLYAPEIGQESIILEASTYLKLPIADFDPVGFRAVPFIDINIFNLMGLKFSYTPMVVSDDQNEMFLVDGSLSYERLETILRSMTQFSKQGVVFLLGGVLSVDNLIKHKFTEPSYTKAMMVSNEQSYGSLLKSLNPKLVIEGSVTKVSEFDQQGFSGNKIEIKSQRNEVYQLIIMNEVIYIIDSKGGIVASVPDRILLVDATNLKGLSGVNLHKNESISILVLDPLPIWKSLKAKKIFGVERFSFLLKK